MQKHLKISIVTTKMIIPALPMHFDDILAAAAVKEHLSQNNEAIGDYDKIINFLPLAKQEEGKDWIWKASVIRWNNHGNFMKSLTQSLDQYKIALLKDQGVIKFGGSSLNTASGPLKSSISLLPSAAYSNGVAFCIGEKEKVERLLAQLEYIGKKHQRGCGKVISFQVDIVEASDAWTDRTLPLSMESLKQNRHSLASQVGVRPPYWLNKVPMGWAVQS